MCNWRLLGKRPFSTASENGENNGLAVPKEKGSMVGFMKGET